MKLKGSIITLEIGDDVQCPEWDVDSVFKIIAILPSGNVVVSRIDDDGECIDLVYPVNDLLPLFDDVVISKEVSIRRSL